MIKKYMWSGVILLILSMGFIGCGAKDGASFGAVQAEINSQANSIERGEEQPGQSEQQALINESSKESVSDMDTSEYTGRYLKSANGGDLIVIECVGPVEVTDRSENGNLFENMENGDLVTVRLGLIRETYPGQSEAFTCSLVEEGRIEDIDGNTLKQLQEMGWLDGSSLGKMEPIKMIFLNDKVYTSTGREAYLTCGTADGQIVSVVGEDKIPQENGQANFNCKGTDYITVDKGGAAVQVDGTYVLFLTEDTVDYEGKCYRKADLSRETLDWLEFYHGLSEEDQAKISMVPHEFAPKGGDVKVEETDDGVEPVSS